MESEKKFEMLTNIDFYYQRYDLSKILLIFSRLCDIMYLITIGGWNMNNASILKAMANAEASIHMEGMTVSDSCKELCRRVLTNEISFEEYLRQITAIEGSI